MRNNNDNHDNYKDNNNNNNVSDLWWIVSGDSAAVEKYRKLIVEKGAPESKGTKVATGNNVGKMTDTTQYTGMGRRVIWVRLTDYEDACKLFNSRYVRFYRGR